MLLTLELVDLAEVVAAQVRADSARFEAKGVGLQEELQPALLAGDGVRLSQVIANLLSNALRYTDAGGHVSVDVHPNGREVLLEVTDTGIGIAPDDVAQVFTRFWRGERSRSRATGGAGIGLAIVKELVEAHGGHVDVSSSVGKGSTFTVHFPSATSPR